MVQAQDFSQACSISIWLCRQDLPGLGRAARDQVGHAVREHARLAAAGARQHQARPVNAFDRLLLRFIEILQVQG